MGDQLTVERSRNCKEIRINSTNKEDYLAGLEPSVCDWHAEFNFLQVCKFTAEKLTTIDIILISDFI